MIVALAIVVLLVVLLDFFGLITIVREDEAAFLVLMVWRLGVVVRWQR